jgi:hypothetical protein
MKPKLEQRTVYAITIVTLLAVSAGWAVAFTWNPLTVNGGANATNFAAGDTIYGQPGAVATQNFTANWGSDTCGAVHVGATTLQPGVDLTVINAPGAGATCSALDYEEMVNFTSADLTQGTYANQFVVSAEFNTGGFTTTSYATGCTITSTVSQCEVSIVIDSGVVASSGSIPDVTAVEITVTGST